jgi:adenine-specific DNA-methyltransferase
MARIDDLLEQVSDDTLRSELRGAVADIRRRKKFGLVFEDHVPESVLLPSKTGVRPGTEVTLRTEPDNKTRYTVIDVTAGDATITDGKTVRVEATRNLLVVVRFGDPVYPVLRPYAEPVVRAEDKPFHAIINGENFHALQLLLFAYERQVDCIYIDPPYNTRDRDWKYNNDYVDPLDSWHHSKWLSMMEKRLQLAKRLLKPDGVLVVMIDEHELHHLGMLLERLFPSSPGSGQNKNSGFLRYVVSIVINGRGSTGNRNFASIEEQAIFVVPDLGYDLIQAREGVIPDFRPSYDDGPSAAERLLAKVAKVHPSLLDEMRSAGLAGDEDAQEWEEAMQLVLDRGDDLAEEDLEQADLGDASDEDDPAAYWRGAVRTGQGTSFRTQRPNQFYPLFIDPGAPERIEVGNALLDRDSNGVLVPPSWDSKNNLLPIWPVDEDGAERVWCFEPRRMREEIAKGNIKIGRFNKTRNTYAVNVRRVRRTRQRFRERTIWWEKSYDAGSNGTNILKKLLGSSGLFDFPKSIYAVRDVLATIVGSRPNALIVDFFAGSGTTLHSTALLNAIDGGSRRCILVTNNEVNADTAASLAANGKFRGDPEYEAMGICRRVTVPRVRAALTGYRPDGARVTGHYKWAAGRPYADGFNENAVFFDLAYEDPDDIEVGGCFDVVLYSLWVAAGCVGDPANLIVSEHWFLVDGVPFAVLLDEDRFAEFRKLLGGRGDISHVWLVTDSDAAFARMRDRLGAGWTVGMLYRDYLRNFRINTELPL